MEDNSSTAVQPAPEQTTTSPASITGVSFVSAYVGEFEPARAFYADLLGLKKLYDMGPNACFFTLGNDVGLYLEGGNNPVEVTAKSVRSTFTLSVASASALFDKLKEAGVKIVQNEPMDMSQGDFWFQFHDPSGNVIEALGGR